MSDGTSLQWPNDSPLVETEWLNRHLSHVIVLDCSVERMAPVNGRTGFAPGHAAFTRGHIPGARFADLFARFSDPDARFAFTCPTRAGLEAAAQAVGIDNDSMVVTYDTMGGAYAARVWTILRAFGHTNVRVLNGGLAAWKNAGGTIETGPASSIQPGNFKAAQEQRIFVGADYVLHLIRQGTSLETPLICGLRAEQFTGADSTDPRRGHIPTSINLPFPDLLGSDDRLQTARVSNALATLGLAKDIAPVLYCGGGINAAGLALALNFVGIDDVKIYDDSMNGWSDNRDLPVEHGDGKAGQND